MHASTWGVGDDDVRLTMLADEVCGEDILHVACIEERVLNAVNLAIDTCILNRLRYIFDTYDRGTLSGDEVSYRPRPRIEVIDALRASELRKFTSYFIKLVGLSTIGLVEGLGPDTEAEPLHLLLNVLTSVEAMDRLVPNGVIALTIDDVE